MSNTRRKKKLPPLSTLKNRADRLWRDVILSRDRECISCGDPAEQAHHVFHKSMHGAFRYDLRNGVPICKACHLLEKWRPALTLAAAIRHLGYDDFMALAEEVESELGRKTWKRRELDLVITGLESVLAGGSMCPRP